MKFDFSVTGQLATARPKVGSRGGRPMMFVSDEVKAWRAAILREAQRAPGWPRTPYTGLLALSIVAYGATADLDNIAKVVQDALNGHAFVDDRQIKQLIVRDETRTLGPGGGLKRPREDEFVGIEVYLVAWDPAEATG